MLGWYVPPDMESYMLHFADCPGSCSTGTRVEGAPVSIVERLSAPFYDGGNEIYELIANKQVVRTWCSDCCRQLGKTWSLDCLTIKLTGAGTVSKLDAVAVADTGR